MGSAAVGGGLGVCCPASPRCIECLLPSLPASSQRPRTQTTMGHKCGQMERPTPPSPVCPTHRQASCSPPRSTQLP